MLEINNTKILLQAEIPIYGECITSCIPYLAHNEESEKIFPNVKIKKNTSLSECNGKIVALSIGQFIDFIKLWYSKSSFLKLYQWSLKEWLNEYLHDNMQIAKYIGLYETCESPAYFPDYVQLYLESINLESVNEQKYLFIDTKISPEFSWCIEDYLIHRLQGENSKYKALIEKRIYESYISTQQVEIAKQINHGISIKHRIHTDLNLNKIKINKDTIDLFCPCEDEFFHTNISHIRKTIQQYIAMGGK